MQLRGSDQTLPRSTSPSSARHDMLGACGCLPPQSHPGEDPTEGDHAPGLMTRRCRAPQMRCRLDRREGGARRWRSCSEIQAGRSEAARCAHDAGVPRWPESRKIDLYFPGGGGVGVGGSGFHGQDQPPEGARSWTALMPASTTRYAGDGVANERAFDWRTPRSSCPARGRYTASTTREDVDPSYQAGPAWTSRAAPGTANAIAQAAQDAGADAALCREGTRKLAGLSSRSAKTGSCGCKGGRGGKVPDFSEAGRLATARRSPRRV